VHPVLVIIVKNGTVSRLAGSIGLHCEHFRPLSAVWKDFLYGTSTVPPWMKWPKEPPSCKLCDTEKSP